MPPPVIRESYTAAFGNLRRLLTTARDTQDAREVVLLAFRAIEASAEVSENLVHSVGSVEDKLATWEFSTPRGSFGSKPLSESKCVSNLKSLGSDKSEFKLWSDKLINALAQTLGTR